MKQIKIIGVEALDIPKSIDAAARNNAKHIQKSLNTNTIYYLYKGYNIIEDTKNNIKNIIEYKDKITPIEFYKINDDTSLNICSIVGVNGSGKSSIIEMIIRIINNFSAVIIGEKQTKPAAEHLHYIDNVYARLYCLVENSIFIISVKGKEIVWFHYKQTTTDNKNERIWIFDKKKHIQKHTLSTNSISSRKPKEFEKLSNFFYTIVCNYSLYAYNVNDFIYELNDESKIRKIKHIRKSKKKVHVEDLCWLKGIFHKNDAYQTPIVLTPFRGNGFINITGENRLAKERLISLFLYKDDNNKFPFRVINSTLQAVSLYITQYEEKKFAKNNILDTLSLKRRVKEDRFLLCYDEILSFWLAIYDLSVDDGISMYKDAIDYLVYKTLKIFKNYSKYNNALKNITSEKYFSKEKLLSDLERLFGDLTHITNKIRQTIAFLKFKHYAHKSPYYLCGLNDYGKIVYKLLEEHKDDKYNWRIIDLLPSPIFNAEIQIYDIDDSKRKNIIPFSSLSAGERQIAYTVSSFLYHLVNINSVWDDIPKEDKTENINYSYVNVMFDEVELYFHPDLQRKFITYLLDGLKKVPLPHIKGIQILMITHSPFVLSDIPSSNILFLQRGCKIEDEHNIKTFASNIHEMLAHNFFMESTIGEFAEKQINLILNLYNQFRADESEAWKKIFIENRQRFIFLIEQVGEDYLIKMLSRMFDEMDISCNNKSHLKFLINKKREELDLLEKELAND